MDANANGTVNYKVSGDFYEWAINEDISVQALPGAEDGDWEFWVQLGQVKYSPFIATITREIDLEHDEEFEKLAWVAYQESVLQINSLASHLDACFIDAEDDEESADEQ